MKFVFLTEKLHLKFCRILFICKLPSISINNLEIKILKNCITLNVDEMSMPHNSLLRMNSCWLNSSRNLLILLQYGYILVILDFTKKVNRIVMKTMHIKIYVSYNN